MLKFLRTSKGVTLVEVLAVIVILGIIAAIAVPTIGNLIENQKLNAAKAEWENIKEAARLYALDEDANIDEDGKFNLDDLLTDGYLTNFDSEVTISYNTSNLRRIYAHNTENNSEITFDSSSGEFSVTYDYEGILIDGILVEGVEATEGRAGRV